MLNALSFLPEHYKKQIDFDKRTGQFKKESELKIAYVKGCEKWKFLFDNSYHEMKDEFIKENPDFFTSKKNGKESDIPYDWTLYYLRQKALKGEKITKEELSWVILSYNQKRGYEKTLGESDKKLKENQVIDTLTGEVNYVKEIKTITGLNKYQIILVNPQNPDEIYFTYYEESNMQITQIGDLKELNRITEVDESGT